MSAKFGLTPNGGGASRVQLLFAANREAADVFADLVSWD
jgi:hypothetical protein